MIVLLISASSYDCAVDICEQPKTTNSGRCIIERGINSSCVVQEFHCESANTRWKGQHQQMKRFRSARNSFFQKSNISYFLHNVNIHLPEAIYQLAGVFGISIEYFVSNFNLQIKRVIRIWSKVVSMSNLQIQPGTGPSALVSKSIMTQN